MSPLACRSWIVELAWFAYEVFGARVMPVQDAAVLLVPQAIALVISTLAYRAAIGRSRSEMQGLKKNR